MFEYIAKRLLVMIPTLLVISALVFIIIQLPPGDYLTTLINELQAQGESGEERADPAGEERHPAGHPAEERLEETRRCAAPDSAKK